MLVLVPTLTEFEVISRLLPEGTRCELCGFGPIAAAARTAQLVAAEPPPGVLLLGIAGSYSAKLVVGKAYGFDCVGCFGIGMGSGSEFQSAEEAGWSQWVSSDESFSIGSRLPLHPAGFDSAGQLLTVCAAAAHASDCQQRTAAHTDAVAEDMEGFGVAVACRLADVPLTILRGISNEAGDRDHSRWQIEAALTAVAKLANGLLKQEGS
jgi:futalosine hydrolase